MVQIDLEELLLLLLLMTWIVSVAKEIHRRGSWMNNVPESFNLKRLSLLIASLITISYR